MTRGALYLRGTNSIGVYTSWKLIPGIDSSTTLEDYVIETSGTTVVNEYNWLYRKWNSCLIDIWTRYYFQPMTTETVSGERYYHSITINLPMELTSYRYTSHALVRSDFEGPGLVCGVKEETNSITINFLSTRETEQGYVHIKITGIYK